MPCSGLTCLSSGTGQARPELQDFCQVPCTLVPSCSGQHPLGTTGRAQTLLEEGSCLCTVLGSLWPLSIPVGKQRPQLQPRLPPAPTHGGHQTALPKAATLQPPHEPGSDTHNHRLLFTCVPLALPAAPAHTATHSSPLPTSAGSPRGADAKMLLGHRLECPWHPDCSARDQQVTGPRLQGCFIEQDTTARMHGPPVIWSSWVAMVEGLQKTPEAFLKTSSAREGCTFKASLRSSPCCCKPEPTLIMKPSVLLGQTQV